MFFNMKKIRRQKMKNTTKIFGYEGGTFSDKDIVQARKNNIPLTMDCALPGGCLNKCFYCGYFGVNHGPKLTQDEIVRVFEEFAALGGKSIKILGEGEPLLRKDILPLLAKIRNLGVIPVLFTCGDVLGSDELAQKIHHLSCDGIVRKLHDIGATVMLKYERQQQDSIVQRKGYSTLRNKALTRLLSAGFNRYHPTRLGFGIVLLKQNYGKIAYIFNFALHNNIYPLVCPLMPIGKVADPEIRVKYSPCPREITNLIQRLVTLREHEGIYFPDPVAFPGGLPCDIARAGMYMDDIGNIKLCEADDTVGNIRDSSLAELWQRCSKIKDRKYGKERWVGRCFPKISAGILECPC